ncbi:four-jointed box protein 1-like [Glandiceps talaboti]
MGRLAAKLMRVYTCVLTITVFTMFWYQKQLDGYIGSPSIDHQEKEPLIHRRVHTDDVGDSPVEKRNEVVSNVDGVPIVEDGIYWSKEIENVLPIGLTDTEVNKKLSSIRNSTVLGISGSVRCGGMLSQQNGLIYLSDGTMMCVRYKSSCWTYGEVLSFYVSRLLGLDNVPLVVLSQLDETQPSWQNPDIQNAIKRKGWEKDGLVSLMEWIDEAHEDVPIPTFLFNDQKFLQPSDPFVRNKSKADMNILMQYTDMIIFDHLIGHYDRLMFREFHLDPKFPEDPTRNLLRRRDKLWMIDNETGFFFALKLAPPQRLSTINKFLGSICIFRRQTAERVRALHSNFEEALATFIDVVLEHEPHISMNNGNLYCRIFKKWPLMDIEYKKALRQRISEVYNQIEKCIALNN